MNTNDMKNSAHNILDEAFKETHPVKRKAHLQMIAAMVTFNDRVGRYEYILANPSQFERQPPAAFKEKVEKNLGGRF